MVLEFGILRLTRLLRSGSLEGKRGGDLDGALFHDKRAEVCTLGLGHLSEVAVGRQFCWHGSGWVCSGYWGVRSVDMLELWQI